MQSAFLVPAMAVLYEHQDGVREGEAAATVVVVVVVVVVGLRVAECRVRVCMSQAQ